MQWIIISGVAILLMWTVWGYYSSNVEQAAYTITENKASYEIRNYAPHIEAQTTVQGDYKTALNQGFRIIAGYIFGGNTKKQSIAMTAPVSAEKGSSETIAMTVPVTAAPTTNGYTIAFVMPSSSTMASVPTPNDSRVQIVEVPQKSFAAKRISWWINANVIKDAEKNLLAELTQDGIKVTGEPKYAGYNAPWTPPWLVRNEVLVPIEY